MSDFKGRGRGESKNVEVVDQADARTEMDRRAQLEAAQLVGMSESEIPIRGRGGFRQAELRTIPDNISEVRVKNMPSARQVTLLCNFVQINQMKDRELHMYRVDYEPKIESASLMRSLFRRASEQLFRRRPIYDDVHECRSGEKLPKTVTTTTIASPGDEKLTYKVTFTYTGVMPWGTEMLRSYNVHMKEFLRMLGFYQPQPGLYVHPQHSTQIGSDIMMLRGYRTSANLHEDSKMLMNLEASHKLVQRKNVLEIMTDIKNHLRQGSNLQETLKTELVGKLVVTAYNKRAYRVEDVDFRSSPESTFQSRDGTSKTFVEYFRAAHNLTINDRRQPLLIVIPNNSRRRELEGGDQHEIKLVPEHCNIAGLTVAQNTDNRLKMDLIRASQIAPTDRVKHLKTFLQTFHSNEEIKASLNSWGYSYEVEPVKLKAHVLPPSNIGFGARCRGPPNSWLQANPETADFNVDGLAVVPPINKMAVLIAKNELSAKDQILSGLRRGFDRVSLKADQVHFVDMHEGDSPQSYVQQIKRLPKDITMAIVVMRAQNKERYDAIKKVASVELGIITQVVTARLMLDPKKAGGASTKIAIQIAAKVGGEPWWTNLPLKGAMVCGYDTYHDTANRGRSYGAFLASMNDRFSRWYSKADAHDRMEEISSQLSSNMLAALKCYKDTNQSYPERVIVYRDGVGEGQIFHVHKIELTKLQEAIKTVGSNIQLVFIIVSKRIGARFYMQSHGQPGTMNYANPPPGTVVDHGVTRPERYDFYLISQSTRFGSVTPTYYNIIHDEAGFSPEIHQKMAYRFCLMYYNWSGSVRVPAPCQYAHKLALLCGEHLHSQPNASLDNRLHFL